MKLVVPTITAVDAHQFRAQTDLVASISDYSHIDLASSDFKSASDLLDYKQTYLEPVLTSSVHIMYKDPLDPVKYFLGLSMPPRMIILQAESENKSLLEAIKLVKDSPSLLGISLLQSSHPGDYSQIISMADQAVIFSGNLGQHGGSADLKLLTKVLELQKIKKGIEIAWDGGINISNISEISEAGVDVFYVGSEIHKAEDPYTKLRELQELVDTTTSAQQS